MSLSSLFVKKEVATMRDVEEALARQVLYGGDLATNLLEVTALDEERLAALIAESMDLAVAPVPLSPNAPDLLARAPELLRFPCFPLGRVGDRVRVCIGEPLAVEDRRAVEQILGAKVDERFALVIRIHEAFSVHAGLALEHRSERLLCRLRGERQVTIPPLMAPPADLATGRAVVEPREEARAAVEIPASLHKKGGAAQGSTKRMRGPLVLEAARTRIEESQERDDLFGSVFDFARQYFDYTALFVVHGDLAEGKDGWGMGAPAERVRGVGVPLDLPSSFREARKSGAVLLSPGPQKGLDAVLLADLGRGDQGALVVIPFVVRGRVVALLAGDAGEPEGEIAWVKDIAGLVELAGQAFEKLIKKKKAQGLALARTVSQPPPPARIPVEVAEARAPSVSAQADREPPREDADYGMLVSRAAAGDPQALERVRELGGAVLPALMRAFPGPVQHTWDPLSARAPGEYGPLLALLLAMPKEASPFVVAETSSDVRARRLWALVLLAEWEMGDAAEAFAMRLVDPDAEVSGAARVGAQRLLRRHGEPMLRALRGLLFASASHEAAARAIAELGDTQCVPLFLSYWLELGESAAVRPSLRSLAMQDFVTLEAWQTWYEQHRSEHRVEWLIQALDHDSPDMRRGAVEALRKETQQYFAYAEDLPKRERQRTQQRYRDWWMTEGRSQWAPSIRP